jgi:hypothetical protein
VLPGYYEYLRAMQGALETDAPAEPVELACVPPPAAPPVASAPGADEPALPEPQADASHGSAPHATESAAPPVAARGRSSARLGELRARPPPPPPPLLEPRRPPPALEEVHVCARASLRTRACFGGVGVRGRVPQRSARVCSWSALCFRVSARSWTVCVCVCACVCMCACTG